MALFVWSDKFSLNIKEIDRDHQKLVGFINELHDAKQTGKPGKVLGTILDELVAYTKTHFAFEETLMRQYEYPEFDAHKVLHESLIRQASDMQKRYYDGDLKMAVDTAIFLNDWLAEHILVEDKKYALYLNSKGAQ